MSAATIPLELFETHDCRTYSCPREAERGYDYCSFCLTRPEIAMLVIPDPPDGLREAILELIPLLGRYELEAERRTGDDLLAARRDLRDGVRRVTKLVNLT